VKENKLTFVQKILRLLDISETSFGFKMFSMNNTVLFSFYKSFTLLASRTTFTDADTTNIAFLKRRFFRPDNAKYILQTNERNLFYTIKFDLYSFNYMITDEDDNVLAKVISNSQEVIETRARLTHNGSRFSSLYIIHFSETLSDDFFKQKLFASVAICIDLIFMDIQD
jgi:hypothetical protein